MAIFRARVSGRLPGAVIAWRAGPSVYAFSHNPGDVDLTRGSEGQDVELWTWMNELFHTCRNWEVYGDRGLVNRPAELAARVLAGVKAAERRREDLANGHIPLF